MALKSFRTAVVDRMCFVMSISATKPPAIIMNHIRRYGNPDSRPFYRNKQYNNNLRFRLTSAAALTVQSILCKQWDMMAKATEKNVKCYMYIYQ